MAQANKLKRASYGVALSRKWVIRAILLAIIVHVGLWIAFQKTILKKYGDPYYERLIPRAFKINRVEIDSSLLEPPTPQTHPSPATPIAQVEIPDETQEFEQLLQDVIMTPSAPKISDPLPTDQPQVDSKIDEAIQKTQASSSALALKEAEAIQSQLIDNTPVVPGRPLLHLSSSGSSTGDITPKFTDLDKLLAQSGPVTSNQPILMDAGLLFAYNSFTLSPAAGPDLQKLAQLIKRTPGSRAVIEGHSDSFGPDKYNIELSQKRALSVKQWLIRNAGIPAQRLSTSGYGNSRLIVPADRSIEEQAINRRVEVLIKTQRFIEE